MEAGANLRELIVELFKRNYKKPKLWVGTIGTLKEKYKRNSVF